MRQLSLLQRIFDSLCLACRRHAYGIVILISLKFVIPSVGMGNLLKKLYIVIVLLYNYTFSSFSLKGKEEIRRLSNLLFALLYRITRTILCGG